MTITTLSGREFSHDASKARKAARAGPLFITDRGRPAHELPTFGEYKKITGGPKFVDFGTDAQVAATQGVAGAVSSASSMNYAARKVSLSKGVAVTDCAAAGSLLSGGSRAGYSMGPEGFPLPIAPDATSTCLVYGSKSATAASSITGIL